MLSKMTFSLVLVFAFALTLIATSVDAQTYLDLGAADRYQRQVCGYFKRYC